MNEKHRKLLINGAEQAVRDSGFDLYQGAQFLLRLFDKHRPPIEAACSRDSLYDYLGNFKGMDESQVGVLIALMQAMPKLANDFVINAVRSTAATMPKGPIGRPIKLTPDIKREIVEKVGRLHNSGVRMGLAQSRVAQQLGIGKRTVQGVWQRRKLLGEQPFQSICDVWRFLERTLAAKPSQ